MQKRFTVIIPTYNRAKILGKCLKAIQEQTYPKTDYEVIIINDGSTDVTEELVKSMINNSPCKLRYFKQEKNRGPAAARNVGIRNANGEIVLFIGDDIIATPTLLEEHVKWHKKYPEDNVAILGYITWSAEIKITPFMQWLENGGSQFAYWQIKDKIEVGPQYFYSSNISLKKKFLVENNGFFDEEFPYAAYEDTELGYRLSQKGLKLVFNKSAIGYHNHPTSLEDACQRMIKVGESSLLLAKKLGEEQIIPSKSFLKKILSKIKFFVYYRIAKFYERRAIKRSIFKYVMDYYLRIGVEKYKNKIK